MGEIVSPEILFILDTLQLSIKVCPGKIWSVHTYHNNINPNTLLWHNGHETIMPKNSWCGV